MNVPNLPDTFLAYRPLAVYWIIILKLFLTYSLFLCVYLLLLHVLLIWNSAAHGLTLSWRHGLTHRISRSTALLFGHTCNGNMFLEWIHPSWSLEWAFAGRPSSEISPYLILAPYSQPFKVYDATGRTLGGQIVNISWADLFKDLSKGLLVGLSICCICASH